MDGRRYDGHGFSNRPLANTERLSLWPGWTNVSLLIKLRDESVEPETGVRDNLYTVEASSGIKYINQRTFAAERRLVADRSRGEAGDDALAGQSVADVRQVDRLFRRSFAIVRVLIGS